MLMFPKVLALVLALALPARAKPGPVVPVEGVQTKTMEETIQEIRKAHQEYDHINDRTGNDGDGADLPVRGRIVWYAERLRAQAKETGIALGPEDPAESDPRKPGESPLGGFIKGMREYAKNMDESPQEGFLDAFVEESAKPEWRKPADPAPTEKKDPEADPAATGAENRSSNADSAAGGKPGGPDGGGQSFGLPSSELRGSGGGAKGDKAEAGGKKGPNFAKADDPMAGGNKFSGMKKALEGGDFKGKDLDSSMSFEGARGGAMGNLGAMASAKGPALFASGAGITGAGAGAVSAASGAPYRSAANPIGGVAGGAPVHVAEGTLQERGVFVRGGDMLDNMGRPLNEAQKQEISQAISKNSREYQRLSLMLFDETLEELHKEELKDITMAPLDQRLAWEGTCTSIDRASCNKVAAAKKWFYRKGQPLALAEVREVLEAIDAKEGADKEAVDQPAKPESDKKKAPRFARRSMRGLLPKTPLGWALWVSALIAIFVVARSALTEKKRTAAPRPDEPDQAA